MKRFFSILILSIISLPCFGFENYILMTDRTVSNVEVKNPEILDVKIVDSNVYNERMMIVYPKQVGKTEIKFCKGHRKIKLWVKVYDDITCIKKRNGVKMVPIEIMGTNNVEQIDPQAEAEKN